MATAEGFNLYPRFLLPDPFNWRSPNDNDIITAAKAQELAQLHFTVCPTNPVIMQRKLER